MYWSAGDDIFIDVREANSNTWNCVCLNDFMKEHLKENTIITVEIRLHENDK